MNIEKDFREVVRQVIINQELIQMYKKYNNVYKIFIKI